jgi:magnesium-transporting ATPase (P-type)
MQDILHQKFATQGFRTLAFAYKDISVDDFERLKSSYNNFTTEADREVLENQLTFIGVFAL